MLVVVVLVEMTSAGGMLTVVRGSLVLHKEKILVMGSSKMLVSMLNSWSISISSARMSRMSSGLA